MKIDDHTRSLLLFLAHAWMADRTHLHRLYYPGLAEGTVQNRLTAIGDLGLIEQHAWAIDKVRQPSMWMLTAKGQRLIASDPAYPGKPPTRSDILFNHDRRAIEVIVRCIEIARESGLTGVQIVRELRLDRRHERPKADALLFLETRSGGESVDTVPMAMGLPLKEEQRWCVAIEAETGKQATKIAGKKATAYRAVFESAEWRAKWTAHYGPPPIVYLVCASTSRAALVASAWREQWAGGHWAITGDEGLAANRWIYHHSGKSQPDTIMRFRNPDELAARKRAEAEQQQKKAAAAQAKLEREREAARAAQREQQAAAWERFNEVHPRPTATLAALLPWRDGCPIEFEELTGQAMRVGPGQHGPVAGATFNRVEQARWRAYEQQELSALSAAEDAAIAAAQRRLRIKRRLDIAGQVANWIIGFAVFIVLMAGSLRVALARDWIMQVVGPLASAGTAAASNGSYRCVEANTTLELREAPLGASVGRIDAGDRVWIRSRRDLRQYDPRVRVQAWRIEQGRVVWTAWIQPAVRECKR